MKDKLKSFFKLFDKINTDIYISDIISITLGRMKARKSRSFLTILGVGVGIGVVYVLVSLTFGVQKLVIGNLATSETLVTLDVYPNTEIKNYIKIDDSVINKFKGISNVVEVRGAKSLPAEINYNGIKSQTLTYGVEPRYFALSNIHTDKGELFSDDSPKIVVSTALLSLFNLNTDNAIGTKIRISFLKPTTAADTANQESSASAVLSDTQVIDIPQQFEISGILNDESNYLYMPLKYFNVANLNEFQLAKVKTSHQDFVETIRDEILSNGFIVTTLSDTLDQINNIFRITQIAFTVIGITALFISSIGMINTMTVSLLEKTREIGIMKSIGATTNGIAQLFLAESVIMGLGGGIFGLAIGFVITQVLGLLVSVLALAMGGKPVNIFYTPAWFFIVVLVFSLMIGLITGIFPAKRAAKLNPLDALRYE